MIVARRYYVSGRVQGVGFRAFVEQVAACCGLRGYARNLSDGRVEVHAEGTAEQHAELAAALWRGPTFARVRGVEELGADVLPYGGFSIRRA